VSNIFQPLVRSTGGVVPFNIGTGALGTVVKNQHLNLDESGAVYASIEGVINHYGAGLPFDINGRLVIAPISEYRFNGIDQYATMPSWSPLGADWEYELTMTPSAIGKFNLSGRHEGDRFYLGVAQNNNAVVGLGGSGRESTISIGLDQAVHLKAKMDATDTDFYVDGQIELNIAGELPTLPLSAADFNIGRINNDPFYTSGTISNLKLTDLSFPGNSRHYPMNEGTGAVFRDRLGDGSTDATIVNHNETSWEPSASEVAPVRTDQSVKYADSGALAVGGEIAYYSQGVAYAANGALAQ